MDDDGLIDDELQAGIKLGVCIGLSSTPEEVEALLRRAGRLALLAERLGVEPITSGGVDFHYIVLSTVDASFDFVEMLHAILDRVEQ